MNKTFDNLKIKLYTYEIFMIPKRPTHMNIPYDQ